MFLQNFGNHLDDYTLFLLSKYRNTTSSNFHRNVGDMTS
jgi:hypothetical protein